MKLNKSVQVSSIKRSKLFSKVIQFHFDATKSEKNERQSEYRMIFWILFKCHLKRELRIAFWIPTHKLLIGLVIPLPIAVNVHISQ